MNLSMKYKLLVLGGSGFIGYHVAQRGIDDGYETYVVCKTLPKEKKMIKGVKYMNLDITKKKICKNYLKLVLTI